MRYRRRAGDMQENRDMRRSGILMPVSSLPSEYGIGAFPKRLMSLLIFLEQAGQKLWRRYSPLGPTGYRDSPYQSFPCLPAIPYFIDLESLVKEGWITRSECDRMDFGRDGCYIDYGKDVSFPLQTAEKPLTEAESKRMRTIRHS